MIFSGKTDIGRKRSTNQDHFQVGLIEGLPDQEQTLLAVVCDGMGGAAGGNVASSLAVTVFSDSVEREIKKTQKSKSVEYEKILAGAVKAANTALYRKAEKDPSLSGMGTTLVACIVSGDQIYAINVGDSRMYVFPDKTKKVQLTRDHSYVQTLVDSGQISKEQANTHPNKNIITRALGTDKDVQADTFRISQPIYALLLCSDGLSGYVSEADLYDIVSNAQDDARQITNRLIAKANENGGGDNITAVVIQF